MANTVTHFLAAIMLTALFSPKTSSMETNNSLTKYTGAEDDRRFSELVSQSSKRDISSEYSNGGGNESLSESGGHFSTESLQSLESKPTLLTTMIKTYKEKYPLSHFPPRVPSPEEHEFLKGFAGQHNISVPEAMILFNSMK